MKNIKKKPIIIFDFGSQYTQLIGRRIRELGVYCEIYPFNTDILHIKKLNPCGFILSGGPLTVTDNLTLKPMSGFLNRLYQYWVFVMVCRQWLPN